MNLESLHLWIPPSVLWTFGAIVALLVVATILVALMRRGDVTRHVELAARVNSWWVLVAVFAVALLFRRGIAIGFFALLSFLAWQGYQALRQDPEAFDKLVHQAKDWRFLAGALVVTLVAVVLSFVRWYLLVRALGLPFTLREAIRLGFVGYLLNFTLSVVGGDVIKSVNGESIARVADIGRALEKDDGRAAVEVQRGSSSHSATIERR